MAIITKGRSIMALFSSTSSVRSHRARFVLAEKNISVEIVYVDPQEPSEDLAQLNPYQSTPTLVDRDLVLYGTQVVVDYLDERYPHPPLMPVDPVSRARLRLALYRVLKDWYPLLDTLEMGATGAKAKEARKELKDHIIASEEVFEMHDYFLSEDMTLVDCAIAPLLWRMPYYGIELPKSVKAIDAYTERLFSRESFQSSLTEAEREMR